MTLIPVILSGGSGTRLWPLSRAQFPKQFLPLTSKYTMIQETLKRLDGLDVQPPIVVCNEAHRFIVAEQLAEIGIDHPAILLEPAARNTAPAIAAAAFQALKNNPNAIMLVLAADHAIGDIPAFQNAVKTAATEAQNDTLVTFGIMPTAPETGYGYIKAVPQKDARAFRLEQFTEKPDAATAAAYVKSGLYYWNSGMFIFKPQVFLDELQRTEPDIYTNVKNAFENAVVDLDFTRLDRQAFGQSPSNSIDYAVMEKTARGMVVPLNAQWNDVGSWSALWEVNRKDGNNNVITGDVVTKDVDNSYIYSNNRLVTALGVSNLIIVDTKDTLLVADRNNVQGVKDIVETLKNQNRSIATDNRVGYRPWGCYDSIEKGDRYKVKHITVKPGAKLSLQMHYHRAEHWIVVSGTAKVSNGGKELILSENESTYIPIGTVHALSNPGKVPLELIEVQSGAYLEEDDIVRLKDDYGRC